MTNDNFYDLYLFNVLETDKLFKLPHLTKEEADKYSLEWFELNNLHDYIFVIEGSTPWTEPKPTIVIKTPEWISLMRDSLSKE